MDRGERIAGCRARPGTRSEMMIRVLTLLFALMLAAPVEAHKPSDAYLTLDRDEAALSGQWDIALRDLDNALTLDANGDGDTPWGQLRTNHPGIAPYARELRQVPSGGERLR